jgi:hypothetical protein
VAFDLIVSATIHGGTAADTATVIDTAIDTAIEAAIKSVPRHALQWQTRRDAGYS